MRTLLFLVLLVLSNIALATGNHNNDGGCRGNCEQTQGGPSQDQSQSADATAVAGAIAGASSSADNHNSVGVGISTRNDVDVNTSDYNANLNANENTNIANGGRGGEGGAGGNSSQGQSQSSDNSNANYGNNSAQNTSLIIAAPKTYRNTPMAAAPPVYASGVCSGTGFGVGASVPGYGASIGGSKINKDCELRETARLLGGLGYDETGFVLLCQSIPAVKAANGGSCTPPQAKEPPVVTVPDPEPELPIEIVTEKVNG